MSKEMKAPEKIKSVFKRFNIKTINKQIRLNIVFGLIVLISTMLLGYLSFDMISDAMIRHAGADNLELVKQITKNIETVMTGFDDISNEILTNETLTGL